MFCLLLRRAFRLRIGQCQVSRRRTCNKVEKDKKNVRCQTFCVPDGRSPIFDDVTPQEVKTLVCRSRPSSWGTTLSVRLRRLSGQNWAEIVPSLREKPQTSAANEADRKSRATTQFPQLKDENMFYDSVTFIF